MEDKLPFEIIKEPFDYILDKYKGVTDESLIVSIGVPKFGYAYIGLGILVVMASFVIFLSKDDLYSIGGILFYGFLILLSLFFIVYEFARNRERVLKLDRVNGLITMPSSLKNPTITFSFYKDGYAYNKLTNAQPGVFGNTLMYVNNKTHIGRGIGIWGVEESWSFYVWYMDKNRPLPPGTAFDKYRQRDFERRKLEGFPKPLYPSNIPTPEATSEQQKERERIGRW